MKYSLGISNFPEEISSLSPSVVFLYFYTLFIEEGLLVSPWLLFYGILQARILEWVAIPFSRGEPRSSAVQVDSLLPGKSI